MRMARFWGPKTLYMSRHSSLPEIFRFTCVLLLVYFYMIPLFFFTFSSSVHNTRYFFLLMSRLLHVEACTEWS